MNRFALWVISLLVMLGLCGTCVWGEVILQDPNTPEAAAEEKVDNSTVDERLAQKITYTSTDKRLHSVIQDISSKSGVTIRCGSSEDDWKVRDLPLVVCAKDIQLGVLLRAIADGLHLQLRATKIDDLTSYRIYRDKQLEKQVETYYQRLKAASLARENWEWDAWARFGSIPDNDVKISPEVAEDLGQFEYDRAREYAKIMALAGPEIRDRVFAGETVRLKAKDAPQPLSDHITGIYRAWWKSYKAEQQKFLQENPDYAARYPSLVEDINKPDPTDEELQRASLEFSFYDGDRPGVGTRIDGPRSNCSPAVGISPDMLKKSIPDLPEPPQIPEPPPGDKLDGLQAFGSYTGGTQSVYETKCKIERPVDKKELVFSDAVVALAKACGFSIVCEDFRSHGQYSDYDHVYGETDLGNAIGNMTADMHWFVDADRKLIVGSSSLWCDRHTRLVPKSMLDLLYGKLEGDGVDIDDAVTIRRLTDNQYMEWIYDSRDLNPVAWSASPSDGLFWKFYDSLSPEDKEKAKSDGGLSLAKFDRDFLAGLFSKAGKALPEQDIKELVSQTVRGNPELSDKFQQTMLSLVPNVMSMTDEQRSAIDVDELFRKTMDLMPELELLTAFPADPDIISHLTLKVKRMDLAPRIKVYESNGNSTTIRTELSPNGFKKHHCSLWITGENTNREIGNIGLELPVYSRKREAKLWEEMQKKPAETADKAGDPKK